eukprot:1137584-Pelagomonas_calceolata.AAC.9
MVLLLFSTEPQPVAAFSLFHTQAAIPHRWTADQPKNIMVPLPFGCTVCQAGPAIVLLLFTTSFRDAWMIHAQAVSLGMVPGWAAPGCSMFG